MKLWRLSDELAYADYVYEGHGVDPPRWFEDELADFAFALNSISSNWRDRDREVPAPFSPCDGPAES